MNDTVREKLQKILVEYGPQVCENHQRLEGLLRDYCGQYRREIYVILAALKSRIVEDLMRLEDYRDNIFTVQRLAKKLYEETGISEEYASWAVSSWCMALNALPEGLHQSSSPAYLTYGEILPGETEQSAVSPQLKYHLESKIPLLRRLFRRKTKSKKLLALSRDERLLAMAGLGPVLVRTVDDLAVHFQIKTEDVTAMEFSPLGNLLATGHESGLIRLWSVPEGSLEVESLRHKNRVEAIAFSADGKLLISGAQDGSLRLWNMVGTKSSSNIKTNFGPVTSVAFSPDGCYFAAGSSDTSVRVWKVADRRLVYVLHQHSTVKSLKFSASGNFLVVGATENLKVWRLSDGWLINQINFSQSNLVACNVSEDANFFVAVDEYGVFSIRKLPQGEILFTSDANNTDSYLCVSRSGKYISKASDTQLVEVWEVPHLQ